MPVNWYSSMKKNRKIRIIFDIENWLWKSEIRIFQSPPAKRTLICQKKNYGKVLFFTQLSCHLMRKLLKKSWIVSSTYYVAWLRNSGYKIIFTTNCRIPWPISSCKYLLYIEWGTLLESSIHCGSRCFEHAINWSIFVR